MSAANEPLERPAFAQGGGGRCGELTVRAGLGRLPGQHAFAWRLHEQHPDFAIRLEYRPPIAGTRLYVDVWATNGSAVLALELKYKTRQLQVTVNGEPFDLMGQGAQDHGRYDTIKDLCRLERIAAASAAGTSTGYSVLLTNDSAYWEKLRSSEATRYVGRTTRRPVPVRTGVFVKRWNRPRP